MAHIAYPAINIHSDNLFNGGFQSDLSNDASFKGKKAQEYALLKRVCQEHSEVGINGAAKYYADLGMQDLAPYVVPLSHIYDNIALIMGRHKAEGAGCFAKATHKQRALAMMLYLDQHFAKEEADAAIKKLDPDPARNKREFVHVQAPLSCRMNEFLSRLGGDILDFFEKEFAQPFGRDYKDLRFCTEAFWSGTPKQLVEAQKKIDKLLKEDPYLKNDIEHTAALVKGVKPPSTLDGLNPQQTALAIKLYMNLHYVGYEIVGIAHLANSGRQFMQKAKQ